MDVDLSDAFFMANHAITCAAQELNSELLRPSIMIKPRLFVDGDQWCALFGDDLQNGVAGFGDSPDYAYRDFDKNWREPLLKRSSAKG